MVICCCPGRRLLEFVDGGYIVGLLSIAVIDVVVPVAVVVLESNIAVAAVDVVVDRLVEGMTDCWRVEQGGLLVNRRQVEEGSREEYPQVSGSSFDGCVGAICSCFVSGV